MKLRAYVLFGVLALGVAASNASGSHSEEAKPLHGGVVSVVSDVSYVLVATKDAIALYVSDHGKAADVAGATAKLTLLTGARKEEVLLQPGTDALEAKGQFGVQAGTKALAHVQLKGKHSQTVRFTVK
mgnify:CR=1 FL=1